MALDRAPVIPGFTWKPVPDTESMILLNELRLGANRPGPELLWDSFDLTVDRLALAMEGNDASLVHIEYMELAIVLREIIRSSSSPSRAQQGGDQPGRMRVPRPNSRVICSVDPVGHIVGPDVNA